MIITLKNFAFATLIALSALFPGTFFYFEATQTNSTKQLQASDSFTNEPFADEPLANESASNELPAKDPQPNDTKPIIPKRSLFTDKMICRAITNAIVGVDLTAMHATPQNDKIIVSLNTATNSNKESYNCKRINNRFYWERSAKFVSQSVIEVEPKVATPRIDELILYIFDPSDRGKIIKSYSIDQLE